MILLHREDLLTMTLETKEEVAAFKAIAGWYMHTVYEHETEYMCADKLMNQINTVVNRDE